MSRDPISAHFAPENDDATIEADADDDGEGDDGASDGEADGGESISGLMSLIGHGMLGY